MKLYVAYQWKKGPYGGGNQFLKALRRELQQHDALAQTIDQASAILINLNPGSLAYLFRTLPAIKRQYPHLPIMARLDGPISLIRGSQYAYTDRWAAAFVAMFVDGLVWQSLWSQNENKTRFRIQAPHEAVIHNAPDPAIFTKPSHPLPVDKKMRIIATSWSDNPRKGFTVYSYLDQYLDFDRYTMTFIGNSPVRFQHIQSLRPLPSSELARELQRYHIYLAGSQNDPCSNALIEALSCGLPVVARRSGGHPELVQGGGTLFTDTTNVLEAIETVHLNYSTFRQNVPSFSISEVADKYLRFTNHVAGSPHLKTLSMKSTVRSLAYAVAAKMW